MQVYIEIVILDNFLLTFLAGLLSFKFAAKSVRYLRVLLACFIGTVAAVFYPFLLLNVWLLTVLKLLLGVALCSILHFKAGRMFLPSLYFIGFTFLFGGSCFAAGFIICGNAASALEFSYNFPLSLVLFPAAAIYYVCEFISIRHKRRRAISPYTYGVEIQLMGQCIKLNGFLDTGNTVFDSVSGLPVAIIGLKTLVCGLNTGECASVLENLDRAKVMKIEGAGGCADIKLIKPQKFYLYSDKHKNRIVDVMLGVAVKPPFEPAFDILLSPALLS